MLLKQRKSHEYILLTQKELSIINKKIAHRKLSQYESNRLSNSIRPKLRQMLKTDAKTLLNSLEYKPKARAIETNIKTILLKNIKNIDSITLFGSAIQTNYSNYNDIDILIITKEKFWKNLGAKYDKIIELKRLLKAKGIPADIELYEKRDFIKSYPSNPSLIYQLKDKKVIYGILSLPNEVYIDPLQLRMKLDYSILDKDAKGEEIHKAIRNLILINLILKKIINNKKLNEEMNSELGKNLINLLKISKESGTQRQLANLYLKDKIKETIAKLKEAKWEKIAQ